MESLNGFSSAEIESLGSLSTTFFPSLPVAASGLVLDEQSKLEVYEFYRASTPDGCSPSKVGGTMQKLLKPAELHIMKKILWLLSTPVGTFVLAGKLALAREFPFVKRFGDLSLETREQVLLGWSTSSLSILRAAFKAFQSSVAWNHFTTVNESGQNPFWKAIGYSGPDPVAISATLTPKPLENSVIDVSMLSSEDLNMAFKARGFSLTDASSIAKPENVKSCDHVLECDVVIVGSGSGGGVAAAVLAKAGFKVIILEKGGYMARQDLSLLEGEAVSNLYEEGRFFTTDDQRMFIMAGSTVGGGSAVNWSASFRTPDHVLREWNEELNLPLFGSQRYREAMDEVCKRLGVQEEIDKESFQNTVLRTGCEKLGYHKGNIHINATPDHHCGWCTFGCRKGMKQGTSETWLVDAAQAGAVILTRCQAQRILHSEGVRAKSRKATGVVAKIAGNDDRHLFIKSRATVVACGSLQTPPLLRRSGLKNPHIGKNLHLHPVQIVWGYFPQQAEPEGNCYEGAIMTAYSNEAANWDTTGYGALIQTPILHPGTFACAMPWKSSSNFKESMVKYSRTCSLIVLLRDRGSGTVGTKSDGSLNIHYKLRSDDATRTRAAIEKALRVLVASGAAEVGSHHQQLESFKVNGNDSDFEDYVNRVASKDGAPLYSAHQMGSCRMGVKEGEGAVDEMCESWEMEGLYLGDASVFPTASGVNPMITIQSIAFCTAHNVVEYLNNEPLETSL